LFLLAFFSFLLGIYCGALYPIPLRVSFGSLLFLLIVFRLSNKRFLQATLLLSCFFLSGLFRMELHKLGSTPPSSKEGAFECTVANVAKGLVTLKIASPPELRGLRALYKTDESFLRGEVVVLRGSIAELEPTFKNPYVMGLRTLKRLEGVGFEIEGELLWRRESKDPFERTRRYLGEKIDGHPLRRKDLIKAITIGDTLSLDTKTKDLFKRTGTSHILAISGTHLGLITGFFFFLSRTLARRRRRVALMGDDRKYAAFATIPFVIFYTLISGRGVATIRSAIMAEVFLFSFVILRDRDAISTTVLSAFLILLLSPYSLFSPSFQLTYLSLVSILLFTRRLRLPWRMRILRYFALLFISSISAFLGTLPVVLYHFYGVNPLSFIHNLFAVPLICGLSMPLALLGLFMPFSSILLSLSDRIIDLCLHILSSLDFGYLYPLPRPSLCEALLFYAFLFSLLCLRGRALHLAFCSILLASLMPLLHLFKERYRNDVCLHFLDVGNGLSILVEGKGGERMLIDGGGKWGEFDAGERVVLPFLLSKKILTLDHVVNTHPHADHVGGLFHVVEHMRVRNLHVLPPFFPDAHLLRLMDMGRQRGANVEFLIRGKSITMKGICVHVLHPSLPTTDPNDASAVIRIEHAGFSFLIPSDISGDVERMLLKDAELRSHVLLVPHHGSARSSTLPFLFAVRPSIAILSIGRGIKGLPSAQTLRRYSLLGIPLLDTQRDGLVKVCVRRKRLYYDTFLDR